MARESIAYYWEFYSGMKLALLSRPPLLVLDEPSTYLDLQSSGKIMSGLRRQDYRPTIPLITHDTALARYGDATYRLEDGILFRQPDLLWQSV